MHSLPTVAIVGRRNVGKSALFNRILEEERAIVSDIPGTTRDRTEGVGLWRGRRIKFVDTGGMDIGAENVIDREVMAQAEYALEHSDLILFVVDLRAGLSPAETKLAKKLARHRKKVILVGNKADGQKIRWHMYDQEWKKFGMGDPVPTSAATGIGVGDLLDMVTERLPEQKIKSETEKTSRVLRIAIVGRPNVGKSALLNSILGEKRVIVSPIPHTTREPQDTELIMGDRTLVLVDTAGIRKRYHRGDLIERGIERTLRALRRSDMALFVIEPTLPLSAPDKHIASLVSGARASTLIIVNKWDERFERSAEAADFQARLRDELPGLDFAPILFISAVKGRNVKKILPLAIEIAQARKTRASDKELAELLPQLIRWHKPSRGKGTEHPVIKRIVQAEADPPHFIVWIGREQSLHFSYVRFIENRLREIFNFAGTPISIEVRQEKAK